MIVAGKDCRALRAPRAVIARGFIPEASRTARLLRARLHLQRQPLSAAVGSAVLDYVQKNRLIAAPPAWEVLARSWKACAATGSSATCAAWE